MKRLSQWILLILIALPSANALAARKTPLRGTPVDQLLDSVRKKQSMIVLVSVSLDEEWAPDARLPEDRKKKQRSEMRGKKDALFARHTKLTVLPGRDYSSIPSFAAVVDENDLRKLIDDDGVESITESVPARVQLSESIPIVGANVARTAGYGGAGQVVVVIDSGVDGAHRFLSGKIVGQGCFTTELPNATPKVYETCPNAAPVLGRPGAEAWLTATEKGTGGGPCRIPDNEPALPDGTRVPEMCAHGTQVAGVAAGRDPAPPFAIGFSGVAPDANVIAINVTSLTSCAGQPNCVDGWKVEIWPHDAVAAMDYVYEIRASHNIAAVNLSFTGILFSESACDSSHLEYARTINQLHAANIAVIASAGNGPTYRAPGIPACIGNAIAVGATTDQDKVAHYSHYGANIDLLAPGGDMTANPPAGITSSTARVAHGYSSAEGTSFSAPHVAGAYALLKQRWPLKTVNELLLDLQNAGVNVADNRPNSPWPGMVKKRLNLAPLFTNMDNTPPTTPGSFMATATSTTSVSLAWNPSTDNVGVTSYKVDRRALHTANWVQVWEGNALSVPDSGLTAATAYQYRIRALDAAGNESPAAADFATTVIYEDDPVREPYDSGGTTIRGIHMARLREAADAWRVFAGLSRLFTYGNATGTVFASHFTGVVDALNASRTTVGLPAFAYANVPVPAVGVVIDDDHVQQLRTAMK